MTILLIVYCTGAVIALVATPWLLIKEWGAEPPSDPVEYVGVGVLAVVGGAFWPIALFFAVLAGLGWLLTRGMGR